MRAEGVSDNSVAIVIFTEGQPQIRSVRVRRRGGAVRFVPTPRFPIPRISTTQRKAYRLGKRCTQARDAYRKFVELAPTSPNVDAAREYRARISEACATAEQPAPKPTANAHHGVDFSPRRRDGRCKVPRSGIAGIATTSAPARSRSRVVRGSHIASARTGAIATGCASRRDVCVDEGEDRPNSPRSIRAGKR